MDYPECEKLKSVHAESQTIGEFLDWCTEQGLELRDWKEAYHQGDCPGPVRRTTEQLLAAYFEIDLGKVEAERQEMLQSLSN